MTIDEIQRNIKLIQKEMLDYLFNISVVKEIKLEDVDNELKRLNKTKKNEIYETMINVYLVQISHHKDKLKVINNFFDEINEYMEVFNVSSYENILYESEFVVDELVLKVLEYNSRKVNLPISLEVIVNYFIPSGVDKKDLDITIMLILVKLSVILDMLNENFNVASQKKLCN